MMVVQQLYLKWWTEVYYAQNNSFQLYFVDEL